MLYKRRARVTGGKSIIVASKLNSSPGEQKLTSADPNVCRSSSVRKAMKGPMYSANQAVEFRSGLLGL